VISQVLKSNNEKIKVGSTVLLGSHHTESFSQVDESHATDATVIEQEHNIPLTAYLGPLGMTGMTAYGLLHEIGQPKKGDVILISAAGGAVGQMVGQIVVREGLHVSSPLLNFESGHDIEHSVGDWVSRRRPEARFYPK
jgi:NADPH-dependent curcumin reductase CurA